MGLAVRRPAVGPSGRRPTGARRGPPVCHGPAAPRPARGRGRGRGGRWSASGRGPAGARRAPRPPPPFQVPSASRRGGLKTPGGGSPVRLGVGAVGPAGSREVPPVSPGLRPSPEGPGWARGVAAPRSRPPRPSGGGYPAVVAWAVAVRGACARPSRVPGGGREPPGRLWGARTHPGVWAPGAPSCETFPDPSGLLFSV